MADDGDAEEEHARGDVEAPEVLHTLADRVHRIGAHRLVDVHRPHENVLPLVEALHLLVAHLRREDVSADAIVYCRL